jgi:hypothetical protein
MDKMATPGFCPHCKTALSPGATACAGCSAFETTAWDQKGLWKGSLFGACFIIPPILALGFLFISPGMALIVWIAPIVAYFFIRSRSKRKIVWAVGGRRLV